VLASEPHAVASGAFQLSFTPGSHLYFRHCLQTVRDW